MTKKTKTASKPLTEKQALIKGTSLVRGMDNSVARIKKETASISDATTQIRKLVLPALSNAAKKLAEKAKAAPKKPTEKAKAAPKKAAPKAKTPKKAAPKAKTPKKAASKAKAQSAAQNPSKAAQNAKPPIENRPTIKEAIQEAIQEGGAQSAAGLWKACVDKYGYWSRQSLYNALKDTKMFKKTGDRFESSGRASSERRDPEVDDFVDSVVKDQAVSQTV